MEIKIMDLDRKDTEHVRLHTAESQLQNLKSWNTQEYKLFHTSKIWKGVARNVNTKLQPSFV